MGKTFIFLADFKSKKTPRTTKNNPPFASKPARENWRCQGEIANNKLETKEILSDLVSSFAR